MKVRHAALFAGAGFVLGCAVTTQVVRGQSTSKFAGAYVSHVGIVVRDAEKAAKTFSDVLGIEPAPARINTLSFPPSYGNATAKVKLIAISVPVKDSFRFEVIQP